MWKELNFFINTLYNFSMSLEKLIKSELSRKIFIDKKISEIIKIIEYKLFVEFNNLKNKIRSDTELSIPIDLLDFDSILTHKNWNTIIDIIDSFGFNVDIVNKNLIIDWSESNSIKSKNVEHKNIIELKNIKLPNSIQFIKYNDIYKSIKNKIQR